MSMASLEREIVKEMRIVAKNDKLKLKNLMEWRTGKDLEVQAGEKHYYLPKLGISVAVKE